MINENFVILGVSLQVIFTFKYLIKTIRGEIQPNKVTFLLWALAPLIAFAAEVKQGVGIQSLLTFWVGFSPLLIFIASFVNKKAQWKLGFFDFTCGALSLAGLFLWLITQSGNLAIIFAITADGLAALPTITKAYHYPETEDGRLFLVAAVSATLTLLTVRIWDFAHYGFPLYILIVCLIIFFLAELKIGKRLNQLNQSPAS